MALEIRLQKWLKKTCTVWSMGGYHKYSTFDLGDVYMFANANGRPLGTTSSAPAYNRLASGTVLLKKILELTNVHDTRLYESATH